MPVTTPWGGMSETKTEPDTVEDRWGEGMGDGDTNRTGMSISMLAAVCVPVGQGGVFSLGLLSLAKWYSLPEQAPIPCSSSQAILISTLLGLHSVLITIYIVYQWHCTYCPKHTHTQTNTNLRLNWAVMIS